MLLQYALGLASLTLSVLGQTLAPLEFADQGKIYFGPWYDRLGGDTPISINTRMQRNMSFFQSDVNITSVLQSDFLDNFITQVNQTNTNAIVYLTVYPMDGFDEVSDTALLQLARRLKVAVDAGRRLFIRYAPEMNGNWFRYGQQPLAFKDSWRRVVAYLRQELKSTNVAFLWAPNSGNGYPFNGGRFAITNSSEQIPLLDTNGNNGLDGGDDPYTPYYPGDDWVDWVGFSIYHYGFEYPWETNDIPEPGKFEAILTGQGKYGPFNFYRMFSGDGVGGQPRSLTLGNKPFFVSETGSTFHLYVHNRPTPPAPGAGRVAIKQSWWREYLNSTFLAAYPKVKAIGTFEFVKFEESSWRDFTNMGDTGTDKNSPFGNDGGSQGVPVMRALQSDLASPAMSNLILWATADAPKVLVNQPIKVTNTTKTPPKKSSDVQTINRVFSLLGALVIMNAIFLLC